jgi:hypothetical protein
LGVEHFESLEPSLQFVELAAQPLSFFIYIRLFHGKFSDLVIRHVIDDLAGKYALQRVKKTIFDA